MRVGRGDLRLRPVFRDRDELASSATLTDSIQAALEASEALLVICSPEAVASRWVNEEIRQFRRMHPQRKVLAFIHAGDPGADPLREPARACFPPCLLMRDVDDADAGRLEPAAPDARKEADGREAAFLKLVAGLLDVPYDTLRQRELRRQQQRWALFGAASLSLSAVFALLAWQAMVARDAAREAQARAELEATTSRQTSDFLVSLFSVSEPGEARGNTITAREVLDRGVERIEATRIAKPLVRSRLLGTMGQVYSGLGLYPRAAELLRLAESAIAGSTISVEEEDQRIDAQIDLGELFYVMGDYEKARDVSIRVAVPQGTDPPSRLRRTKLQNLLGDIAWQDGEDEQAREHYTLALAEIEPPFADVAEERGRALGGLGRIALLGEDPASAVPLLQQAHSAMLERFGPDHPDVLVLVNLRASAAYQIGESEEARRLWADALATGRRIYGDRHPEVATYLSNLALLELEAGRFASAESMFRETISIDREVRVDGFDELAYTLNNLALARTGLGDNTEAEALLREALGIATTHGHPMRGPILANLADVLCSTGRRAEGVDLAQQAVEASGSDHGPAHWRTRQAELIAAWCGAPPAPSVVSGQALQTILTRWGKDNLYAQRSIAQAAMLTKKRAHE
jgi:tetratricopeptide (TPR) repeat protein